MVITLIFYTRIKLKRVDVCVLCYNALHYELLELEIYLKNKSI